MQPSQAEKWITEARFAPNVAKTDGDHDKAVALYVWNARISAVMFETLHHVEVILRNAIDSQFAPFDAAAPLRGVHATAARISREGKTPTRGRVVAGLSFGFWRALFDKKYDRLWVSHLHRAFPGGSGNRAEIATLMSKLVPFRNRLAHHETIIGRPVSTHYEEMLTLARLVDPDAGVWIEQVSQVKEVLNMRPGPH